jgi:RNA polymerase sigma factor (sigma-70 family)
LALLWYYVKGNGVIMVNSKVSELEKLEELILEYKAEVDAKRKHIVYLRLVEETMKLVKKIVITFYPLPNSIAKEDLIQVGAVGVLRAIEMYKTEGKGSFKTYVTKVIRGKIFHYLRDKANIVKPPRDSIENMTKVKEAIEVFYENNNKAPTTEDIAQIVNLPADKVEDIMNLEKLKNMVSLDQNIYTADGGETLLDRVPAGESETFEDAYANKRIIEDAISKLPQADKTAISMYYIDGESRKDIAKVLNVSVTQVSRILKRALNKMYIIIKKELDENSENI